MRVRHGERQHWPISPLTAVVGLILLSLFTFAGADTGPGAEILRLDPHRPLDSFVFENRDTESGLPQGSANAIVQTSDGYLWVGTYEGLARFDGVRFRVYANSDTPALRSSAIWRLMEDKQRRLWIGTIGGGLSRFEDGGIVAVDGLVGGNVNAMIEDNDGIIWVGTESGLNRFEDGRFALVPKSDGWPPVRALACDHHGSLWIGTAGAGVLRLLGGQLQSASESDADSQLWVNSLEADGEGGFWVGTSGAGLKRLREGVISAAGPNQELPHLLIQTLYDDHQGALWIGTFGGGLYRLVEGQLSQLMPDDGVTNRSVLSMLEDREGSLWFGTDGGLNRLTQGTLTTYSVRHGLGGDFARVIVEDLDGRVWVGTDGGGLSRFGDRRFERVREIDGLLGSSVRALAVDRSGGLWAAVFGKGVYHIADQEIQFFGGENGLSNALVRAMTQDRDGSLLIGHEKGIDRLEKGRFSHLELLDDVRIASLVLDSSDRLWIGTYGEGVGIHRDSEIRQLRTTDGLASNVVFSIHEDPSGTIWICTQNGLNRVDHSNAVFRYRREHGLPERALFHILEDAAGSFWISTGNGILNVPRSGLDAIANGDLNSVQVRRYDHSDGMLSSQCNGASEPAGCRTRDGRLWFPTAQGVVVIDPEEIRSNPVPPPVAVEKIVADGQEIFPDSDHSLVLDPGLSRLEIHYTALSLLAPEKVRFKAKLGTVDRDWIDVAGRRVAYYTNLDPGKYLFEVQAANNDGVWNETGAALHFEIKPFLYQTSWFYPMLAVALIALTYGTYRSFASKRKRETMVRKAIDLESSEALAYAEERYRTVANHTYDWETWHSPEGDLLYVSPSCERITGYSADEFLADNHLFYQIMLRADRKAWSEHHRARLHAGRKELPALEIRLRHKNGGVRWIEHKCMAVSGDGDLHLGVRGSNREITRRKVMEEENRHAREELAHVSRVATVVELSASLSHEISQPLTAVRTNARAARNFLGKEPPDLNEVDDALSGISDAAERAGTIIHQLRSLLKREEVKKKPLDLNAVVSSTVEILKSEAIKHRVEVSVDLIGELPPVAGDRTQIQQVLLNLMLNAFEAMQATPANERVLQISTTPVEHGAEIVFRDSGPGIAPAILKKVLEPFVSTKDQGLGMGLAISRSIIEAHGGRIHAKNSPNGGASFVVSIPATDGRRS